MSEIKLATALCLDLATQPVDAHQALESTNVKDARANTTLATLVDACAAFSRVDAQSELDCQRALFVFEQTVGFRICS